MASIPSGQIFLQGFPRGSMVNPGTTTFLNLFNHLSDNISSNPKLFADDASLF